MLKDSKGILKIRLAKGIKGKILHKSKLHALKQHAFADVKIFSQSCL
jgi:hypothetical protein